MPRKAPQYKADPKSQGESQLRELPGRVEDIAAAVGVAKTLVHEWRTGAKKPTRKNRERIARAFRHIHSDAWEELPQPAPVVELPAEVDPAEVSNLDACNRLLREIRAAASQPEITPTTREKLAAREIAALRFREDLLRREQLLEDDIVRKHPEWVKVRERLAKVVAECCSDCSSKLIATLAGVGA